MADPTGQLYFAKGKGGVLELVVPAGTQLASLVHVHEILDRKIKMFELVVGEMEEILGAWQPHGSFEDEVFRRWVDSRTPAARKRRFAELAQHLLVARKLYQTSKEQQGWLYPTVQKEGGES